MSRTALLCRRCGNRCGSAERLPDDRDLVHVTTSNVKRRGSSSGLPVHVTRGQTLRLSEPDGWPLVWRCQECRSSTDLRLDRDTARRIGAERQIVVSMSMND